MFHFPGPEPQPSWKRPVYLLCSTLLFVVLSFGLHAVIEQSMLQAQLKANTSVPWYTFFGGQCALPPWASYGLLVLGVIAGPLIGRAWWRWVYIERRWSEKTNTPKATS